MYLRTLQADVQLLQHLQKSPEKRGISLVFLFDVKPIIIYFNRDYISLPWIDERSQSLLCLLSEFLHNGHALIISHVSSAVTYLLQWIFLKFSMLTSKWKSGY